LRFQSLLWILCGFITIFIVYKKILSISGIDLTLTNLRQSGVQEVSSDLEKLTVARLKKKYYRQAALVAGFCYALIVANSDADVVKGWHVLALSGLLAAYLILKFGYLPTESLLRSRSKKLSYPDEMKKTEEKEHKEKILKSRGPALLLSIGIVLLSGNWAFQVQKNQSEEKLWAMNQTMKLVGEGWCANFWDIDANPGPDGDYDVIKTGGWPCINVASVSDVQFREVGDDLEMCFTYSLGRSDSTPEDDYGYVPYKYDDLCSSDNYWDPSGGWDEDSLL
jgi:hypothetical protein